METGVLQLLTGSPPISKDRGNDDKLGVGGTSGDCLDRVNGGRSLFPRRGFGHNARAGRLIGLDRTELSDVALMPVVHTRPDG